MADDISGKTCLVVDRGLFVELASRLSRDFARVLYYCDWKSAFPKRMEGAIGEGVEGIERVYDLFDAIDEADLIVFPDIYDGDLQHFLRERNYRVWGAGNAEHLELNRVGAKEIAESRGVESPPYVEIIGLDELRKYLTGVDDAYIKVSNYRGDFETFHHEEDFITESFLNVLQERYGPLADEVKFLVEGSVEGVEIAYDGYTIDGKFPSKAMWGVEVKDRGYVGRVVPYVGLPKQIQDVNAAFAPDLAEGKCRSFVSFEMRVQPGGVPVVIDPCLRCGNPPTELWMEMYGNLGQILWHGAVGELIEPEFVARTGAMLVINCQWATKHWSPIMIPPDIRQWVKIRMLTNIDGKDYYVPSRYEMAEIGAVVGIGDTIQEAVALVQERAGMIAGYAMDLRPEVLDEAEAAVAEVEAGLGQGD